MIRPKSLRVNPLTVRFKQIVFKYLPVLQVSGAAKRGGIRGNKGAQAPTEMTLKFDP